MTGIPYVTTCHGFFKPKISRRLWKCWGERVIAISEAVRTHLVTDLKVPKNRIKLIYNGIDLEDFSCSYTDNQKKQFREEFGINNVYVKTEALTTPKLLKKLHI